MLGQERQRCERAVHVRGVDTIICLVRVDVTDIRNHGQAQENFDVRPMWKIMTVMADCFLIARADKHFGTRGRWSSLPQDVRNPLAAWYHGGREVLGGEIVRRTGCVRLPMD